MIYEYYTCQAPPEQLDSVLTEVGKYGWLLTTLVVLQTMTKPVKQIIGSPDVPVLETKFLLIFYRIKQPN